jgi:hypothetical protein
MACLWRLSVERFKRLLVLSVGFLGCAPRPAPVDADADAGQIAIVAQAVEVAQTASIEGPLTQCSSAS